jgi:hypothetical protein
MLAVRCPHVTTGRGERLVSERRIRSLVAVADGFLLTVACPCGEEHAVAVRRPAPLSSAA